MKHLCSFFFGVLLICSACRAPDDPRAAAAVTVVEDLLPRAPQGLTPYLAPEWQIPRSASGEPVPAAVLEQLHAASGLPLAAHDGVQSRDPHVAVLYLVRPQVVRSDSVVVVGGWMGLSGGDGGGAWGEEYTYLLDCRRGCRIVQEPGTSSWN